jgi:hypothetical protein
LQKPLPVSWIEAWLYKISGFQYQLGSLDDGGVNGFGSHPEIIGNLLQNQYIAIE